MVASPVTRPATALQILVSWCRISPVLASTTNSMRWWLSGSVGPPASPVTSTARRGAALMRSMPAQTTYCAGLNSGCARNSAMALRVHSLALGNVPIFTPASWSSKPRTSQRLLEASTAGKPDSLRVRTMRPPL
ncbi:MAG: hypothetical protein EBU31_04915 [Proteobacteria bacterium]|nr:hypothetical protein [Pseudomonadota bacterium]